MKFTGTYEFEDLRVGFVADGMKCDYGVPRSPEWWDIDENTIEVEYVEILGMSVDLSKLPSDLMDGLYDLSDNVTFEKDYGND